MPQMKLDVSDAGELADMLAAGSVIPATASPSCARTWTGSPSCPAATTASTGPARPARTTTDS
jgi:hypothetical protein